jgi:endogenous inhibitor of DNA gyrase (YacG/DUF329 family)
VTIRIQAKCTECGWNDLLFIDPEEDEVNCPACQHASKSFDEEDFDEVSSAQKKTEMNAWIAVGALVIAFFSFMLFLHAIETDYSGADAEGIPVTMDDDDERGLNEEFLREVKADKDRTLDIRYAAVKGLDLIKTKEEDRSTYMYAGIGGMGLAFIAMMYFGVVSSTRKFICEF